MKRALAATGLAVLAAAALLHGKQPPAGTPNTIWVTASVIHRDGHLVSNLGPADFDVKDRGETREITTFRNDPIPIAVALMVDVSASMEANYGLVRRAVTSLASTFQPGDRAIIGSFDALPWIGGRFSARPEVLQQSLAAVFGGTLFLCDGDWIDKTSLSKFGQKSTYGSVLEFSRRLKIHGGSAIWDGAACGINAVASDGETPRRVVVLMTDGMDTMSSSTVASVLTRANGLGVMIYAVSLMGGYGMAGADLKSLAEQTGGGYFYLTGEDKVASAFARIGDELRHQYVFGFASNGPVDGPHAITVTARTPDTTTRFRRVLMELPGVTRPVSAGTPVTAVATPTGTSLPPTLAILGRGAAAPATGTTAAPVPRAGRSPFWDTLDQFARPEWQSGAAPRMSIDGLRGMLATLRRDGVDWIRAVPAIDQPARRLATVGFVLDLLYTQNDPYLWLDNQPAPDLLDWSASALQAGPPTPEERLWYFGAIALLERAGVPDALERFALRASRRFPDESRFALARGVAQDLRTWPEPRDAHAFAVTPAVAAALVARYEEASMLPAVRTEAMLRLAYFDLRRGRIDAALARFEGIRNDPANDTALRFWLHLLRGRALEQAGRLPDAIDMFQQALDDVPAAPSARSALIAALAKARRPAEAARIAAGALSTPPADVDPWTLYVLPDMRYWNAINEQLRKAVTR
jgi:VWFA-related protein